MNIDNLMENIKESINLFHKNELAYLSLTGKNELQIRDKLAYTLYMKYPENIVLREHKFKEVNSRIDLLIGNKYVNRDIIELKSMYTFDAKHMKKFLEYINKDFKKNEMLVDNRINQYEIIIASNIKSVPSEEYSQYIKYYRSIKKHTSNISNSSLLVEEMNNKLDNEFKKEKYNKRYLEINAGQAFGVDVDICIWVLRKR